jgi:hypothetical protein
MNLEKVFNFIKEKKGYSVPTLYKLLNDIPVSDDEKIKYYIEKIKYSKESDRFINILLSSEGLINKLGLTNLIFLLMYSTEPEKIINILGNKGIEYINKLHSPAISKLLKYSKEPEKIMNILGNKGIEFIDNLNLYGIRELLKYSKEKDKIRAVIRKYRPDVQLK